MKKLTPIQKSTFLLALTFFLFLFSSNKTVYGQTFNNEISSNSFITNPDISSSTNHFNTFKFEPYSKIVVTNTSKNDGIPYLAQFVNVNWSSTFVVLSDLAGNVFESKAIEMVSIGSFPNAIYSCQVSSNPQPFGQSPCFNEFAITAVVEHPEADQLIFTGHIIDQYWNQYMMVGTIDLNSYSVSAQFLTETKTFGQNLHLMTLNNGQQIAAVMGTKRYASSAPGNRLIALKYDYINNVVISSKMHAVSFHGTDLTQSLSSNNEAVLVGYGYDGPNPDEYCGGPLVNRNKGIKLLEYDFQLMELKSQKSYTSPDLYSITGNNGHHNFYTDFAGIEKGLGDQYIVSSFARNNGPVFTDLTVAILDFDNNFNLTNSAKINCVSDTGQIFEHGSISKFNQNEILLVAETRDRSQGSGFYNARRGVIALAIDISAPIVPGPLGSVLRQTDLHGNTGNTGNFGNISHTSYGEGIYISANSIQQNTTIGFNYYSDFGRSFGQDPGDCDDEMELEFTEICFIETTNQYFDALGTNKSVDIINTQTLTPNGEQISCQEIGQINKFRIKSTVGIAEDMNSFEVYPNPFNDQISVELDSKTREIQVYNAIGKKVFSQNLIEGQGKIQLNLADLPKGVYFIRAIQASETKTKKVLKQ